MFSCVKLGILLTLKQIKFGILQMSVFKERFIASYCHGKKVLREDVL